MFGGEKKKEVYLLFSHFSPFSPHHPHALITALNADVNIFPTSFKAQRRWATEHSATAMAKKKKKNKRKMLSRFAQTPMGEKLGVGGHASYTKTSLFYFYFTFCLY